MGGRYRSRDGRALAPPAGERRSRSRRRRRGGSPPRAPVTSPAPMTPLAPPTPLSSPTPATPLAPAASSEQHSMASTEQKVRDRYIARPCRSSTRRTSVPARRSPSSPRVARGDGGGEAADRAPRRPGAATCERAFRGLQARHRPAAWVPGPAALVVRGPGAGRRPAGRTDARDDRASSMRTSISYARDDRPAQDGPPPVSPAPAAHEPHDGP